MENWTLVATLLDSCRDDVLPVRQREARAVPLDATASVRSRWPTVASPKTWFSRVRFSRPLVTAPPPLTSTTISPVPTVRGRKTLEKAIIGKAVDLLSGPGGLASFLRVQLSGPSLPLDIGYSETIPAGIRNAVMLRDKHCQWAGGYFL